ncbi:MAG: hypothetical protein ACYCXW_19850 [Solirubrobacteraceae bacterium]
MRYVRAPIMPLPPRQGAYRPPGWPDRAAAWLRARRIDLDLASGELPWSTTAHAARALQLAGDRQRISLAAWLERLVDRSSRPPSLLPSGPIEPCREQIDDALPVIEEITSRLRGGGPLNPRGLAALRVLLQDGGGPCYIASSPDALTVAAQRICGWLEIDG